MNKRESEYWPIDASNGLSYSKMKDAVGKRHPRRLKNGKLRKFSVCSAKTGWHCCWKSWRQSDLQTMGVGLSNYFKMLKFFMVLFLWFAFLSVPAYFLYFSGNISKDQRLSANYVLSAFSLGNIGQCTSSSSLF